MKVETHDEDLAVTDQAATQSQPDVWEQRYNGLKAKLLEVQNQLAEAKVGFKSERDTWTAERQGMLEQTEQLRQALQGAEGMIGELTGKWNALSAQADTLNAQLARQQVILRYPQLISDPVVKLVQTSQLGPEDLEATLNALASGQQQLVKQVYQEAQTGATASVSPATGPASAKQEQTKQAWQATLEALQRGDMATYNQRYNEYLVGLDQVGQGLFNGPRSLSKSM